MKIISNAASLNYAVLISLLLKDVRIKVMLLQRCCKAFYTVKLMNASQIMMSMLMSVVITES